MVPDKFNMVDMDGIDLIMMQGEEVPGLYNRLVESIAQCRYQCLYNWFFDGIVIPPSYVEMEVNEDDEVAINEGITVSSDDVIHIYSVEPGPVDPEIIPLLAEENGVYNVPSGKDGFNPVTVDVPSYTPVINSITIEENGTYTTPSGVDGYSPITVNVSGGGDPAIPNEYQKVEYLSVTGTQYVTVQSGLGSDGVMTVIDISQDVISTSESGFAGYNYSSSNVTELYVKNSVYAYMQTPSLDRAISEDLSANTRYSVKFVWPRALGSYFNIGQYRPNAYSFTGKIYRAEFIPQFSNSPSALLIPCYRKSDSEPGFYDVVNSVFYTNVGTGMFGVGPDAN